MEFNIPITYVNKWVALTDDRKKILASAQDLKKLDVMVKKNKFKNVIYHYVLPFNKSLSP